MDIKVFMTNKCSYIPNGTEIYNNVDELEFDDEFGLSFVADFCTIPVSRKSYRFKPFEIEKFQIGDFSKEIYRTYTAMMKD